MGVIKKIPASGLADALFTKTQRRVLGLLFGNPDRTYYANEIVRFAGAGIGAVQRELEGLATAQLVNVTRRGNQKHFQANRAAPIFEELRGIVLKTFGVADVLRDGLVPLAKRIPAAFIYGSIAKGSDTADSDIDLMVVSDKVTYADVFGALEKAAQMLQRQVNPTVYTKQEFAKRLRQGNAFATRVWGQPKIWLIGDEHAVTA